MERVERTSIDGAGMASVGAVPPGQSPTRVRVPAATEWPTVLLSVAIYAGWLLGTGAAGVFEIPVWVWAPPVAWAVAWHASLQHEVIHGHPTPSHRLNRLIAGPPLLIWLPYDRYRDTHLAHHVDDRLTDPLDDPESWYLSGSAWRSASRGGRVFRLVLNTLTGRLLLGPWWLAAASLRQDAGDVMAGRRRLAVLGHAAQVAAVLGWLWLWDIPAWLYLLAVVWPATSLLALRTFAEHRPAADPAQRSVIVDRVGPLSLLYLSNNLHALHHERPGLPWFVLSKIYRANRESVLERNGGYRFSSYFEVFRRYFVSIRDHPVHPNDREHVTRT